MTRRRLWLWLAAVLALGAPAAAQTAAGSAAPPATPEAAAPNPHAAPANPHGGLGAQRPEDSIAPAEDLPAGTIEAQIVDPEGAPLPGVQVRLGIMFQKISEGESRSERFATSDANGRVRFERLEVTTEYSYRITVKRDQAEYGSSPFNLGEKSGWRVKLHVFPVTSVLAQAPVGVRGFVYIEPRDDVFQLEVLFRVVNIGLVTWVPDKDVVMKLPAGFKAFSAQKGMTDVIWEHVDGVGARLKGTFTPGQADAGFRFQMPKSSDSDASFAIGLLPRLFELRVIAGASSNVKLAVTSGSNKFPDPTVEMSQKGERVLVTGARFTPSDEAVSIDVMLSGLPVPGIGRWIAALIAAGLGGLGLAAFRGMVRLDSTAGDRHNQDLVTARELLLAELVDIERSHKKGDLGPRAYGDARRTLLEALARLGRDVLSPAKKKRRRAAA